MSLLEVSGLSVRFGDTEAVSDVSFSLQRGERFGIIGESGSGKTLTALAITGLLPDNAAMEGSISLDDAPLPASERAMARLRGKRVGMVFQEPMTALNPLMRVHDQIEESIRLNEAHGTPQIEVPYLLREVGLELKHGDRFPHQLSGGQRQRVAIARALMLEPKVLLLDEPTSALDVSVQAEILNLLKRLRREQGLTYLLVTHNLPVVSFLCDRLAVMRQGRIVEVADVALLKTGQLAEPYSRELLAATEGRASVTDQGQFHD